MILAGDIGGTNTRLALFDQDGRPQQIQEFPSRKYSSLEQILAEYLRTLGPLPQALTKAAFGVAGPVENVNGWLSVKTTNLPWKLEQARLAEALHLRPQAVGLLNDLAANAAGIDALDSSDILVLQRGETREGNRGIISAGTGLGVAGLMWDAARRLHIPVPSEGGHGSFGPRDELQDELLRHLRDQDRETFHGHVSWERVLSGPGFYNLFDFLRARGIGEQKLEIPPGTMPGDAAKLILVVAMAGTCPRSMKALELFVSLYGAAAGNVALQFLALGGLYVGGGIAPRIREELKGPSFLAAFLDKGPLRTRVLEKIPVRVILDPHTALRGAGRYAERIM
jgi:glucokinase